MEQEFEIGDVVTLNSEKYSMTIANIRKEGVCVILLDKSGKPQIIENVHPKCLKKMTL